MDDIFLEVAVNMAKISPCLRRQYGAVIAKDGKIISLGSNTPPPGAATCQEIGKCSRPDSEHGEGYELCKSVHAEQNAIIHASKAQMEGATLYLACLKNGEILEDIKPCNLCMRMIQSAGITKVVTMKGVIYDV